MNNQPDNAPSQNGGAHSEYEGGYQGPGFMELLRFLNERRHRLALYIVVLWGLGILAFILLRPPKAIEGIVGLGFSGIEIGEYPSGKRFSVEDFRSPNLLTKALADTGISSKQISIRDLSAHIYITPIIPPEIQGRWKKQEQSGQKREEFSPNEFRIAIEMKQMSDPERRRLWDALVARYQESLKYEQQSALAFAALESNYRKFTSDYDPWDIPDLFREAYRSLTQRLNETIAESLRYQDASYQLSFREIAKDLDAWERTRLQVLEAITYQGQLARDRDVVIKRIQYRMQDLDIRINQDTQETNEALKLLEVIERPRALLAGQLNSKEGLPMIDASALDKLVKSDYVGPVVQRISRLQSQIGAMETEKARLEKQLSWLPKTLGGKTELPPEYNKVITALYSELTAIVQKYNSILEDFLKATITNLVVVKQSPVIGRSGLAAFRMLFAIAVLGIVLALLLLGAQRLFEKVRR